MRGAHGRAVRLAVVCLMACTLSGCFFPEIIEIFISGEEGSEFIAFSFSATSDFSHCTREEEGSNTFTCTYLGEAGIVDSTVSLSGDDILFLLLLDPLIVQLPTAASNFAGSYLHNDSGMSGSLAITSGLASFDADFNTTVTSEPGTQFVILALPNGAPTQGSYSFNFTFELPASTSSLALKAMFTGRVDAGGQTYYPPLLPCVTNFASVPSLNVPFPAGGGVPIPVGMAQGCNNVAYIYGAAAPVPSASRPALLTLALLLFAAAAVCLGTGARLRSKLPFRRDMP